MVKKLIILISTLALLITPGVVSAENYDTTTTSTKEVAQNPRMMTQENLATIKEERKAAKDEFRAKLATIKDERKKMIVERIDAKIATANANLTQKMTRALTRMSGFLERAKVRSTTLKSEGKDTAALDAAISAAETAITSATTAITEQQGKTYTASITDETTLKNNIGQIISTFRLDIQSVHKLVVAAKQSIAKVIVELAKFGGIDKTATNSATINN